VAIPVWVKQAINAWMTAAGIEDGRLVRSISKGGKVGKSLGAWSAWSVVEQSAKEIGIDRFGAHDLRRDVRQALQEERRQPGTDQIPPGALLDRTTERYLGSEQEIAIAVNDSLGH
jgi:integrase